MANKMPTRNLLMNYERSEKFQKYARPTYNRVQKLLVNVQKVFGRAHVTVDFDKHHFFLSYIPAVGSGMHPM